MSDCTDSSLETLIHFDVCQINLHFCQPNFIQSHPILLERSVPSQNKSQSTLPSLKLSRSTSPNIALPLWYADNIYFYLICMHFEYIDWAISNTDGWTSVSANFWVILVLYGSLAIVYYVSYNKIAHSLENPHILRF